jgi:hypothetical protein
MEFVRSVELVRCLQVKKYDLQNGLLGHDTLYYLHLQVENPDDDNVPQKCQYPPNRLHTIISSMLSNLTKQGLSDTTQYDPT